MPTCMHAGVSHPQLRWHHVPVYTAQSRACISPMLTQNHPPVCADTSRTQVLPAVWPLAAPVRLQRGAQVLRRSAAGAQRAAPADERDPRRSCAGHREASAQREAQLPGRGLRRGPCCSRSTLQQPRQPQEGASPQHQLMQDAFRGPQEAETRHGSSWAGNALWRRPPKQQQRQQVAHGKHADLRRARLSAAGAAEGQALQDPHALPQQQPSSSTRSSTSVCLWDLSTTHAFWEHECVAPAACAVWHQHRIPERSGGVAAITASAAAAAAAAGCVPDQRHLSPSCCAGPSRPQPAGVADG